MALLRGSRQIRRVGGSGSGATFRPAKLGKTVTGGNARKARTSPGAGWSLANIIGTTQPIAAMQSRVMPSHGLSAGACFIIFMQSVVALEAGSAATAATEVDCHVGPAASAACWPNRPSKAPTSKTSDNQRFISKHAAGKPTRGQVFCSQ